MRGRKFCIKHYNRDWHNRQGPCSIEGCDRKAHRLNPRGYGAPLCQMHYHRWIETGSVGSAGRAIRPPGRGYNKDGYIIFAGMLQHRRVMAEMIGRPLHPWETVHHKNTVRDDNRPENLELWMTPQPRGGRLEEVLAFFARHYADELRALIDGSQSCA